MPSFRRTGLMSSELLNRLETALESLLNENRLLESAAQTLRQEKDAWQQERGLLLTEVDKALERIEKLQQGDA